MPEHKGLSSPIVRCKNLFQECFGVKHEMGAAVNRQSSVGMREVGSAVWLGLFRQSSAGLCSLDWAWLACQGRLSPAQFGSAVESLLGSVCLGGTLAWFGKGSARMATCRDHEH